MLARPAPRAPSHSHTTAVWDRVAQAASSTTPRPAPRYVPGAAPPPSQCATPPASSAPAFPALVPSRTPAPQTAAHRQANRSTTAWSASASGASPAPAPRGPPPPSSVNRTVPRGPPPKLSNSAFPELPTGGDNLLKPDWQATAPESGWLRDFVIIRPAWLTDGDAKGDKPVRPNKKAYRVGELLPSSYTISRKDVAHFIAEECVPKWDQYKNRVLDVAY